MPDLSAYKTRNMPGKTGLIGGSVRVEPLNWDQHGEALGAAICGPEHEELWRYIPLPPVPDLPTLRAIMDYTVEHRTWKPMAIVDTANDKALGMASYMRLRPEHGSCEVGCIVFGPALQRTRAATESMYLMAKHAFDDLGYRRYEWKCDNDNAASKRAAARFGFVYEGLFRQDLIVKGRNRDTAWFSITDKEWPAVKAGFEAWLSDDNFDGEGTQRRALDACRG